MKDLKESYELIENIKEMVPEAIKLMHKTAADPKYKLLREDLRYLANNKRKTHSSIITKAKKAVNQAVKSMISLAKLVNKQLPSISSENEIKVKSPDQYTNKIKSTDGHWEVVLYLVEKKQQKINKQIDDLRTELNEETLKKIKNSSEYKSFQKNLDAIKKMIMEKTTSRDPFQYF